MKNYPLLFIILIIMPLKITSCQPEVKEIERPEKIVSKRQVVYDDETYHRLANLWKDYFNEFPSEDAYANWMYAARYAKWSDYKTLLDEGVTKYPANPTLLYLKALIKNGEKDNLESISLFEKAVELDPTFLDPWFGLAVDYMSIGELEKSREALKNLLEEDAISDEVMDYNYNVISLLDKNAILITNGDNDTYPAWILTKLLKYRPDVKIVNRSLLNTKWYPLHIVRNESVPDFVDERSLTSLREQILEDIKSGKMPMPSVGPFSDTLITNLIVSSQKSGIPVYLASTLYQTRVIKEFKKKGVDLGLVTRIGKKNKKYSEEVKEQAEIWLNKFRTGGLESWKLKSVKGTAAGKWLAINYGESLKLLIEPVRKYDPESTLSLFKWYKKYILKLLPEEKAYSINSVWCKIEDIKEIKEWCDNL